MNLDVAIRAVPVLRVQVVLRTCGLLRPDTMRDAMAGQTKLCNAARNQQTWIGGAVWCVTRNASFCLNGSMLVNKRSLFVCMTLDTSGIGAGGQSRLFELKAAVRIVAVAASHRAFQHLVVERQVKLVLGLAVTIHAKLWLAVSEQAYVGKAWLLCVCLGDKDVRSCELPAGRWRMGRVTVDTADVVAPVLAATEVVVFFPAGVTD